MRDGIIKATGNSWNLKSVPDFLTLYPTYEAFVQALTDGTLPVDLNGMNPAGWSQMGTMLNKANLLKDATAALYGLGAEAVPDEVLAKAGALMNAVNGSLAAKSWIAYGSYTGSGGEKTLNVGFDPWFVSIIHGQKSDTYGLGAYFSIGMRGAAAAPMISGPRSTANSNAQAHFVEFAWGAKSMVVPSALNTASQIYHYILLG